MKLVYLALFISLIPCSAGCSNKNRQISEPDITSDRQTAASHTGNSAKKVINGADRIETIKKLTEGKRVALIVNQTSTVGEKLTLLPDTLMSEGVNIVKLFAPEHGFRGDADAGETVKNGLDVKTGLPIVSLYGRNKKPSSEQLADVDVVIFDIQDVGARFYTYISTMLYAMQSSAEFDKEFIVLDRPNPNDFVEGPVLKDNQKSFVGTMPIPVLHGMTVGELARMIVGEGWLGNANSKLKLDIVQMQNWQHGDKYSLPVKPSPNLPNDLSVRLYPSLCLFEGTDVSVGRGTYTPFQVIGYPDSSFGSYTFTPEPLPGFDKNPLQKGKLCYGYDLSEDTLTEGFTLKYIIDFYNKSKDKQKFFSRAAFFDKLAGDENVRKMIMSGKTEEEIRAYWQAPLDKFKAKRAKYLIYK